MHFLTILIIFEFFKVCNKSSLSVAKILQSNTITMSPFVAHFLVIQMSHQRLLAVSFSHQNNDLKNANLVHFSQKHLHTHEPKSKNQYVDFRLFQFWPTWYLIGTPSINYLQSNTVLVLLIMTFSLRKVLNENCRCSRTYFRAVLVGGRK